MQVDVLWDHWAPSQAPAWLSKIAWWASLLVLQDMEMGLKHLEDEYKPQDKRGLPTVRV